MKDDAPSTPGVMHRRLGVPGAVMMGLGSILGTGVFVSIGLGAGVAGPGAGVVLAIVLAGLLALCNGLSSAQLAAAYPVSGGTYEYGYRLLSPSLGFTAGWMFLCAKSASAATAALGCVGYVVNLAGVAAPMRGAWATGVVLLLTLLVLSGLRRTNPVNFAIVAITIVSLTLFIAIGAGEAASAAGRATGAERPVAEAIAPAAVLHATALMFVAFTGYGRIATLGEEVREPRRTIPAAVLVTLAVSAAIYVGVAVVCVGTVGAARYAEVTAETSAPLEAIASGFRGGAGRWLPVVVSVGAVTAMLGVLLNLVLGLSRVALAMGRRGDLPGVFGRVSGEQTTPVAATLLVGGIIAVLALVGSVKAAWSFSAFTVLIYYGITNLAALRLPAGARMYPRAFAWAGLVGCAGLAWFVEPVYWGVGVAVIAAGLVWHAAARRFRRPQLSSHPTGT